MTEAYLSEVFESIEGEGAHAGTRALFLRFGGCNLRCGYCDTGYARERADSFTVSGGSAAAAPGVTGPGLDGPGVAGPGDREIPNPVACPDLLGVIVEDFGTPVTVVITGGEPLLQPEAVAEIARELHLRGCAVHLETNGTLPEGLAAVRHTVDFVSMDVKLPSLLGGIDLYEKHEEFMKVMAGLEACIKIVVSGGAAEEDLNEAAARIAAVNPALPVFIQPVFDGARPLVGAARLSALQALLARRLRDVRVSVQMHKILGVR